VVSLFYGQLTHSIGLNDLCDSLQLHSGPLASMRGATRVAQEYQGRYADSRKSLERSR
jgi:hypothetical protein